MFKAKAAVHSGNGRIAAVYVYEVEKPDVRPLGGRVSVRRSECRGLHGETRCLLKAEEEVHGVDSVACATFQQIIDYSRDEHLAVDFVEVDDALVGVDHVFEVGNLGCDESTTVRD